MNLIIDFYSEAKFQTIQDGNSYITVNEWKTNKTRHYQNIKRQNKPFNPTDEQIRSSMEEFTNFLKMYLKDTEIILNKTKAVLEYKPRYGSKRKFPNKKGVVDFNNRWSKVDSLFEEMIETHTINHEHKYLASSEHIWGLMNVHYEKGFYKDLIREIKDIYKNKLLVNTKVSPIISKK